MKTIKCSYMSEQAVADAHRLADCLGELINNWMHNNSAKPNVTDPLIVLTALGLIINGTIKSAPTERLRLEAATAIIDMILDHSNVERPQVIRLVDLLTGHEHPRKHLDA